VLAEASAERKATLIATGSEVELALAARDALEEAGIPTAVVSLPCWELFALQDPSYHEAVLGSALRVGIEAALEFGWSRWLGPDGIFVGMQGFGASAPAPELYKHFGITADAVVAAVKRRVN
jgi:transketolase